MSYSQNDEEEVILKFFENYPPARLLDIGAYDGIQLSNTRALLEKGWSGVLVEPAPRNVVKLMENCRRYPNVMIIQAAVAANAGIERLYIDEEANREWSTTLNEDLAFKVGSVMKPHPARLLVPVISLYQIAHFGPFQFLNIDAEWEDFNILKTIPSHILSECELICIEPRGLEERAEMISELDSIGYSVHYETRENIIAERKT